MIKNVNIFAVLCMFIFISNNNDRIIEENLKNNKKITKKNQSIFHIYIYMYAGGVQECVGHLFSPCFQFESIVCVCVQVSAREKNKMHSTGLLIKEFLNTPKFKKYTYINF